MNKKTFTGKLINYERRNCSVYGNPRFYGEFENKDGEFFSGTTASDAQCGYGYIFLNNIDSERTIKYHVTRTGNTIIDYISF